MLPFDPKETHDNFSLSGRNAVNCGQTIEPAGRQCPAMKRRSNTTALRLANLGGNQVLGPSTRISDRMRVGSHTVQSALHADAQAVG